MTQEPREKTIDSLLQQMTLQEKVGQLNFYVGDLFFTGPTVNITESNKYDEGIAKGEITGLFNIYGAAYTRRLQEIAVNESRLGIPLVFGADVIHGLKTVFPIPLATAASWDLGAIEQAERISAIESTASGINFNFAPMVDISRDARWGRVAESAGEDPYLGALVAGARVRGMQGNDLSAPHTMAACIKHFAAYGAPDGGREYNTVDMSELRLRETYLPPYKAGIDAGAATLMTSFNELNGVPVTGSEWLLREILRQEWGFEGMIVSDWQSIGEMVSHGIVASDAEAAELSLRAGVDMDMMSDAYLTKLPALVESGALDVALVDEAVRRVLALKYDLGLFDDPYRYCDEAREEAVVRSEEHLAIARDVAMRSIVLLKNEDELLPLSKDAGTIAVIGPLADDKAEMNGTWSFFGEAQHTVSFLEGIQTALGDASKVLYAKGCNLFDDDKSQFAAAVATARKADVVVLVVGEAAVMNGEAASRTNIKLPGVQSELVEAIVATGKPIVAMVQSGRPLDLTQLDDSVPSILELWTLGSESGTAAARVLFGEYNPAAKLPMSFPRHVGQVPIYYDYKQTGRMYEGEYNEPLTNRIYLSKYRDERNSPLYPFGHGLSYTTFEYSPIHFDKTTFGAGESITASVEVRNTGDRDGEEVVQLYIRDLVGSVTRPVRQLKGFEKVMIKAGERVTVSFEINEETISFWRRDLTYGPEPGEFTVMIGTSSENHDQGKINYKNVEND